MDDKEQADLRKAAVAYARAAQASLARAEESQRLSQQKNVSEKVREEYRRRAVQNANVALAATRTWLHPLQMKAYREIRNRSNERADAILRKAAEDEVDALVFDQHSGKFPINVSKASKDHKALLPTSSGKTDPREHVKKAAKSVSKMWNTVDLVKKLKSDKMSQVFDGPCLLEQSDCDDVKRMVSEPFASDRTKWEGFEQFDRRAGEDCCDYMTRVLQINKKILIKDYIGHGATGGVFLGLSKTKLSEDCNKRYAIKVSPPSDNDYYPAHIHKNIYESFKRISNNVRIRIPVVSEARVLSLTHRETGKRKNFAVVMGMSYEKAISVAGVLQTSSDTLKTIRNYARALQMLHKQGFAHGDAHAGNFMVSTLNPEWIVIIDFDRSVNINTGLGDDKRRVRDALKYDLRLALMSLRNVFEKIHPYNTVESKSLWEKWAQCFGDAYMGSKGSAKMISVRNYAETLESLSKYRMRKHANKQYGDYRKNVLKYAQWKYSFGKS